MRKFLLIAVCALFSSALFAQDWVPKKAALMSKFAKDVDPKHVLAEYPRPQLVRTKWMNLNGLWQYQPATENEALPSGKLSSNILVPFPVESALSGVMEHHERLWYRKTVNLPQTWKGEHVLIHFGAVDYESEVYVNGTSMGIHSGGYDPFTYDITSAIKGAGPQEITVRVYDPTDKAGFPRGKQTLTPGGIMYQSVTGIWQTVWLEPVPATSINNLKIVPDIDKSVLKLTVNTDGAAAGATVSIKVKDGDKIIKTMTGKANTELSVPVANAKLWSPDHPFLYTMDVTLIKGKTTDRVSSYFGMRKISVVDDGGYKKLYLNNKFLFEVGPLDQGFWPDGGYTAPTDAALKYDLEMTKKFGFNMVRKHIKVEPYRWYYWTDKLGLLVWQDMPSPNSYLPRNAGTPPPVDTVAFRSQLKRIVETHWNSPSIVTWIIFNESQSQSQQNTPSLVKMVKELDPSRLVNQGSGGSYFGAGDYLDVHSYPDPNVFSGNTQVLVNGEYGGIGYIIPGHTWSQRPTYIMIDKLKDYTDLFNHYSEDLAYYKTTRGLSAAVYTETTDVESELNGLMTYDREVVKAPVETIKASNDLAIKGSVTLTDVLPTSQAGGRTWKYTFDKPDTTWLDTKFNDATWQSAVGGFGSRIMGAGPGRPNATPSGVRTVWSSKDIWMRQEFTAGSVADMSKLVFYVRHHDNCTIYINGVRAADIDGHSNNYSIETMTDAGKKVLVPNGKNVIAIHCHQISGAQDIDAGIMMMELKRTP